MDDYLKVQRQRNECGDGKHREDRGEDLRHGAHVAQVREFGWKGGGADIESRSEPVGELSVDEYAGAPAGPEPAEEAS